MDRMFKKYSDPFLFLETLLETGDFTDWVDKFVDMENESQLMEVWLHKVYDQTYEEFKNSVMQPTVPVDLEATVNDSMSILNGFIPVERGES